MNLPDIPLLGMLRQRMSWLESRQSVLAQNVANADTPSYVPRDLKPQDFSAVLRKATTGNFNPGLAVTDPRHIAITPTLSNEYGSKDGADVQSSPDGNSVSLEQEMIKVADTQSQYQAATNLYSKAVSMMRTAIGHS